MADATRNCCRLGAHSVYAIQQCTSLQCHFKAKYVGVQVYLAVTCHLHFWQNDRDLLRAAAVTWEWNGYRNAPPITFNPYIHELVNVNLLEAGWRQVEVLGAVLLSPGDYVIPFSIPNRRKKVQGQRVWSVIGHSVWNSLPLAVRHAETLSSFRSRFKTRLFSVSCS